MAARIKKTKPKNSGTPVKRKQTANTKSCIISRRKQYKAVKTRHKMGYEPFIADSKQQCTGFLPLHSKTHKIEL